MAHKKHDKLMAESCENRGCDRHLLGLFIAAKSLDIEIPELFKDVSWRKRLIFKHIKPFK